jgi:sugar fermentation stimulation protein A
VLYSSPLIFATLLRRYKRFLADMRMEDGGIVTVHCANPGSMLSLAVAGRRCWLSHHAGTARKLAYSWELEEAPTGCIGINTARANTVVAAVGAAVAGALFAWWAAPFVVSLVDLGEPLELVLDADWRTIAFGVALTMAITALFGLAPAIAPRPSNHSGA